jgi:hypothetical protein
MTMNANTTAISTAAIGHSIEPSFRVR